MTAANNRPWHRACGAAARWAMWAFVIVNVVVVEVLFLSAGSGKNEVLAVALRDDSPLRRSGGGLDRIDPVQRQRGSGTTWGEK
ncbi:hypothetical protein [Streptomyces hawaiiensis]|uniref:hypothetical protein n=1 Tax=Streptomyces hawaiiensis TaxID=67305 RepID=UPI003651C84D